MVIDCCLRNPITHILLFKPFQEVDCHITNTHPRFEIFQSVFNVFDRILGFGLEIFILFDVRIK